LADKTTVEMSHGAVLPITEDCRIHFGKSEAEIKL
jgi:hypothetical protein